MPELSRQHCDHGDRQTYAQAVTRRDSDTEQTLGPPPGSELVLEDNSTGVFLGNDPLVIPENTTLGQNHRIYESPIFHNEPLSG